MDKLKEIWNNFLSFLGSILVIAIFIFYAFSTCNTTDFKEKSITFLTFIVCMIIYFIGKHFISLFKNKNIENEIFEKKPVDQVDYLNPILVESIIKNYAKSLSLGNNNFSDARPFSYLKNSIFEIENAYKYSVSELIRRNKFNKEIEAELLAAYMYIDCFVDDEVIKKIKEIDNLRKTDNNEYTKSNQYLDDMQFITNLNLEIIEKNMKRKIEFYSFCNL